MFRTLIASALFLASATASAQSWPVLADPCTSVRDRGPLTTVDMLPVPNINKWDVAYPASHLGNEDQLDAVVFIVNANGAKGTDYLALAEHLARQNYLVRIIQRPNGTLSVDTTAAAMQATFDHFDLPADFPVAVIGHSRGGGTVMEIARLHHDDFNLRSVVSIAPNVDNVMGFLGTEAPAFLTLYGSQDEDMSGLGGTPREAFAALDLVNTEDTTTSPVNRFLVVTPFRADKAMVYVRGADHSGFIGSDGIFANGVNKHFDYLSVADQACIAKAYITGFLAWHLLDRDGYRDMFYGDIVPPSISQMHTAEPDWFGNPAGAPLQIFHQFSPEKRFVLADFWSTPTINVGAGMTAQTINPNAADSKARHFTKVLHLAWQPNAALRNAQLTVPINRRKLGAFDRLQLRIGQITTGNPATMNPPAQAPWILISLVDGQGKTSSQLLGQHGRIPAADRREGGSASHSQMNTIAIPMASFTGIDRNDVRFVRFWVLPNTQGEVMIDNIEAVYDF